MSFAAAPVYHDLQSLSALHFKASNTPETAVAEVATQFESLFMQMMLKSMRDATVDGGLFDSDQMEHYQSMFDQQLSLDLSARGSLGLSDILVEQLGGDMPLVDEQDPTQPRVAFLNVLEGRQGELRNLYSTIHRDRVAAQSAQSKAAELGRVDSGAPWQPSSAEEFVRGVWEYAVTAAKQLGLDPQVLVAQSALETGWGKKLPATASGQSSFNLFGIKSGGGWNGQSATINTLEFRNGVAVKEVASFRAYDSLADSFDDYVGFLKSNPRYQQALESVDDNRQFLIELQDAGYATDPKYADKIMAIVGRSAYSSIVHELKNS